MIIKRTGSADVITVEFVRIARFASQPRCGRVGYGLYQKSSNTFWGQLGGQMNICDDGAPPRRQCPGTPVLVAAEMPCADGSRPVDTPEIRTAIARAVAGGSLGMDQVRARPDARPGKDGHGR
jgi:hypothetical protein